MSDVTVVVGAQFGSEGKGAVSAHLTKGWIPIDLAIRVAGPNAGHTAYDKQGREWKLRCIPVAAVTGHSSLYLAPGSEIDLGVFWDEISQLEAAGHEVRSRLKVHPSATVILEENLAEERANGLVGRIGSTGKGVGSARAGRLMRLQPLAKDIVPDSLLAPDEFKPWEYDRILIEGTQGYGLGLHTRFYPQVTSSDCRAIDFLAMAGISPWSRDSRLVQVVVVARVYPIRVAGNSGPLTGETTWAGLGLPEERTTVTNKVRRVGVWDGELVKEAVIANGGGDYSTTVNVALTMLDQKYPELAGRGDWDDKHERFLAEIEEEIGANITYIGTGPETLVER